MLVISDKTKEFIIDEFGRADDEIQNLRIEVERVSCALPENESHEKWSATLVLSGSTEKIYSGFEKILVKVIGDLDGKTKKDDAWHASLLRAASGTNGDARTPVISEDTYHLLNELRGFRHRERNSYAAALDLSIVIERAGDALKMVPLFKTDISAAIKKYSP
jgi:hypothetical protein